jgi:hypothetical protein
MAAVSSRARPYRAGAGTLAVLVEYQEGQVCRQHRESARVDRREQPGRQGQGVGSLEHRPS